MRLTLEEAKEKCIAMWEHIAKNVTSRVWRDAAKEAEYTDAEGGTAKFNERFKWHAIYTLFPKEHPKCGCYLCDFIVMPDCTSCPLSVDGAIIGCQEDGEPFNVWHNYMDNHDYKPAARAALRLVEKVRAWEVEDDE